MSLDRSVPLAVGRPRPRRITALGLARGAKRTLDAVVALTALVLITPLVVVVAVAIRVDSRGPVFFRQQRVGRGGRRFRVVKFRTMVRDAEERREALLPRSEDPHWLKLERDPRVTRVGRWLRMTSLDELPQLLNVLRGDMSLVGPRPLVEAEDAMLAPEHRLRAHVRPGLTGLWQVSGRTRLTFAEMAHLDCAYVRHWSFTHDLWILVRTVPVVLFRHGAN